MEVHTSFFNNITFMFDIIETFLIQFIGILPFVIPFILIMNLIAFLLWGSEK